MGEVQDRAALGVSVDLIAVERHLAIGHAHELRVEQRRDDVAWGLRDGRIEQPRLADVATKRAALMPVSNDQVAGVARCISELLRGQHAAIVMKGFQCESHCSSDRPALARFAIEAGGQHHQPALHAHRLVVPDACVIIWRTKNHAQQKTMTIVREARNAVRQAFHKITDWRRRRRDQRRHEHLLRLESEYCIPDFLRAPDPQLPPRPPAEVGKESPTPISRIVTPDMEIIIFSDGHQLEIPRLRKGR